MLKDKYTNKTEYEKDLLDSIIAALTDKEGSKIFSSIVLTGSFGRGEPTYSIDSEGYLMLKSDVEIACIYKSGCKRNADSIISKISEIFKEDLNLMPLSEKRINKVYNFNGSIIVPRYKTVFTYDLFNGSRTVWGIDFISNSNAGTDSCNIDMYEAKRLVANRIGEFVYLSDTEKDNKHKYLTAQWKGKIILAIAGGWLICEGNYVSSYHGQYENIHKDVEKISNVLGKSFLSDYEKVFNFLRDSGSQYNMNEMRLRKYVKEINFYFKKNKISTPRVNSLSRSIKYIAKYYRTNKEYGIINFEDNILQSLISQFINADQNIIDTANVWRKVLY